MKKKPKVKLTGIIILVTAWAILLTGIVKASILIWLILLFITIIFYFAITKRPYTRKRDINVVLNDMDEYMERKAKEINEKELEKSDETGGDN